ncbi:hypothetical protein vseg_012846 [Gypsophila vaccaria]
MTPIVEHVVLFNVKEDTEDYPTKVNAMVNALNSLASLDSVLHLTAGPILRTRSKPDHLKFTHMLHARYLTRSDLQSYSLHPDHVSVVDTHVRSLCKDVLAVDWAPDSCLGPSPALVPRPGSAMRLTLLQVEDEGEGEAFFEGLENVKSCVGPYEQVSYGTNFSDRGKGYTVGTLVVFSDLNELDACEEYEDLMNTLVDKIKCDRDGILAVDYLVPRASAVSSNAE